jgi:hypothetical protein
VAEGAGLDGVDDGVGHAEHCVGAEPDQAGGLGGVCREARSCLGRQGRCEVVLARSQRDRRTLPCQSFKIGNEDPPAVHFHQALL